MNFYFNIRPLLPYFDTLQSAVLITIAMSVLTMVTSLALGLVFAVMRQNRSRLVRFLATAYVEFFRNVPLLIVLYFVYFMMPAIGLRLSPFQAGLVGMTLHYGAYMTEIIRAGLIAIAYGQYEAGNSQGMTRLQVLRHIVMPQVFRTIYPPLGNQLIAIILGSSLCSAIAVIDIASWMQTAGAASFRYFETFAIAALVYFILCQIVNLLRIQLGRFLFRAER
jgi:His/Glu/Gln/Arg/opine family amino acid ABC transporter permease subunit